MRIKLFSCHHRRPVFPAAGELFMPIWSGGEADAHGRWLTDLDGLNIHTQPFDEMRQQFFVWRNLLGGLDHVGFEHYRRLLPLDPLPAADCETRYPRVLAVRRQLAANALLWRGEVDVATIEEYLRLREELSRADVEALQRWIARHDVIVPRRYLAAPVDLQWRMCGLSDDVWQRFVRSIEVSSFWRSRCSYIDFAQIGAHFLNMFILRSELFDEYMSFWAEVMFNVQGSVDPASRQLGFLSERLFSYWMLQKQIENPLLRVAELPHLFCAEIGAAPQPAAAPAAAPMLAEANA